MAVINIADENFDAQVLGKDGVVLVDFWAPWCAPCRALSPTLDALATEYEGRAKITKINVDDSPASAQRFGVRSIPALFIFKDGERVESVVGAQSKDALAKLLDKHL